MGQCICYNEQESSKEDKTIVGRWAYAQPAEGSTAIDQLFTLGQGQNRQTLRISEGLANYFADIEAKEFLDGTDFDPNVETTKNLTRRYSTRAQYQGDWKGYYRHG